MDDSKSIYLNYCLKINHSDDVDAKTNGLVKQILDFNNHLSFLKNEREKLDTEKERLKKNKDKNNMLQDVNKTGIC